MRGTEARAKGSRETCSSFKPFFSLFTQESLCVENNQIHNRLSKVAHATSQTRWAGTAVDQRVGGTSSSYHANSWTDGQAPNETTETKNAKNMHLLCWWRSSDEVGKILYSLDGRADGRAAGNAPPPPPHWPTRAAARCGGAWCREKETLTITDTIESQVHTRPL